MKKILLCTVLVICMVFSSLHELYSQESRRVLLYIRDGSGDLNFTLKNEVCVMKQTLEQSGFLVMIATLSGQPLSTDSVYLVPDLKLSDADITDFSGLILPCMHAGASIESVNQQAVSIVNDAARAEIPIAVQHAAIMILAKAGLVKGKQYTFHAEVNENEFPDFKGSIYKGRGVVRDGNIIISGVCSYLAMLWGLDDNTEQLTQSFIEAINEKTE